MIKIEKFDTKEIIIDIDKIDFSVIKSFIKTLIKKIVLHMFQIVGGWLTLIDRYLFQKGWLVIGVGLGVGLGLSVIVSTQPDSLQAYPSLYNRQPLDSSNVSSVRIPSIDTLQNVEGGFLKDTLLTVSSPKVIHDLRSAQLGEQGVMLLADASYFRALTSLPEVQIGDKIIVKGQNNGIYNYSVVETRSLESTQVEQLLQHDQEVLILYSPVNVTRTKIFAVVARRI